MYKRQALATGAKPVEVKENRRTASIENICAAITAQTKIIFLANPNNPTGTMISEDEIEKLLNKIPRISYLFWMVLTQNMWILLMGEFR